MVDEADNPTKADADDSPTPVASRAPAPPYDRTIKLDRAIVERDPTVPERFGRYEVIGRIGIGGFASVFSARDPELDAPVAIKVLAENHSADVEVRKRFVAEARVARRLGSDRLIGVFDLGETDDGRPYVVMELASGGTLRARLTRTGRPSRNALLRLIQELGSCMIAIHAKDVVHRDIKPSNLLIRTVSAEANEHPTELLDDSERLVLADFGLARDISDGASAVTVGGGTAGYMAPEQADPNGRADFRADIYAATVVVAELTTGRHPERLDLGTADLGPAIREALEEGLSIDRERRPASAVAWRDRLLGAYRAESLTAQLDPDGAPTRDSSVTATIPATEVEAPYPYGGDSEYDLTAVDHGLGFEHDRTVAEATADLDPTEIFDAEVDARPESGPAPVGAGSDDGPPPPPPSIPLSPRVQPPRPGAEPRPPTHPERPVRSRGERTPGPAGPGHLAPPGPQPAPGAAPPQAERPLRQPAPGSPPGRPATAPGSVPNEARRPIQAQPDSPRPRPLPVEQLPPPPVSSGPGAPHQPPQPQRQPGPPGPGPGAPALRANVTIPDPAGPPAGPSRQPIRQPAPGAPGPVAPRSRREAKLEERAARRNLRRRRRRRRRRRISNVFRALIRGALAAIVTFVVGLIVAMAATGQSAESLPRQAEVLLNLAMFAAFFFGMQVFPWPRRLDPDG